MKHENSFVTLVTSRGLVSQMLGLAFNLQHHKKLKVVAHVCHPSTREVEKRG